MGEFKFMDLLYSRYASPMDLIKMYISRGRFGEFVTKLFEAEDQRRKEQAEKENDLKLWIMYVHSYSDESFFAWKKRVLNPGSQRKANSDYDLNDERIMSIIDETFEP